MIGGSPLGGAPIAALDAGIDSAPATAPFGPSESITTNPVRRKVGGFVEIGQTLLLTTLAVVAAATVFRDPFVTTVAKPKAAQHEVGTNNTLLRAAAQAPFRQNEWAAPSKARHAVVEQQSVSALLRIVATQDPFRQNDWATLSKVRHFVADQQGVNSLLLSAKPHSQTDWYAGAKRAAQQPGPVRNYLTSAAVQVAPFSQTDWDNPVSQRKALRIGYHRPSFDPGAPVASAAPFSQSDWYAGGKRPGQYFDVARNYLTSVAVAPATPFFQSDWQNPVWPKNRFGSQTLDLAPFAFAAPFAQYEWYVGAKRRSADSGFAHSLALVLIAQPVSRPFAQYVWQNPQASKNVLTGQSIKTSALVVQAVERPFNQYDWQNPGFRRTLTGQGLKTALIASSTSVPFAQLVWDNPKSARRTLTGQAFKTGLIVSSSAAPFSQTEWTNPVARPKHGTGWTQNGVSPVLTTVVAKPFAQTAWDNPSAVKKALRIGYHRPSFDPGAPVAPGAAPFFQSDWQNPVWPKDRFGSQTLDLTVYAAEKPFAQNDWQNPVRRYAAQDAQQSRSHVLLATPVAKPFFQSDWQNPVRQNKTVQHHQQSGASLVLTTAVPQPFSQNDWQNPVRVPSRITVTHHRPSFDPGAPIAPTPPFFQSDWQNPVWLKDRFGGQSFDLTVYSFDKPFVQSDWQNPVCRPKTAQDFLQNGASRVLTTVVLRPFSQNDWQNPKYFVPRDPRFSLEGTPLPNEIPPAVTPPADEPPRGDGGWRRKHRGPDYKKFEEKRRKDKEFEDELRALYAELIEEPKAAEIAAEIVEPITASEAEIPPPSQVRFEYATDEIETALLLLETRIAEFKAERAKEQQVAAEKLAAAQEAVRLQEAEDKRLAEEAEDAELDELMELYDLYEIIQNLD